MRVLWTHNFDPSKPNSQVYMNTAAEGLRALGVDLTLEYLGNLRSLPNLMRARRHVRDLARGFDLVHAQYGSACGVATHAAQGIPRVVSIRGNDWSVHDDGLGFYYVHTRLARAMTRATIRGFDAVVSVSNRMAGELRGAGVRNVHVIPSPVNLDLFVPRDRPSTRSALGAEGDDRTWILFNALNLEDPIKRYPLAKAAVEAADAGRGKIVLRVASDLAHADIPAFTAACDLILLTSETEGWPNNIKEAMACNVPFVATDVSDLREIAAVEPSCRVCAATPDALAAGIREALSAPRPTDLRKHVAPMSLEASSQRLLGVYESLLDGGRLERPAPLSHATIG